CYSVSDLEVVVAVKTGEVANLNTQNAGLLEKVSALELVRGELDGKVSQLTADCDGLRKRAAELDAHIADVRRNMENDLNPHMLTAIAGRQWVIGHGFCLAVHHCARSVECRSALGKVISMAINKGIQQGLEAGIVHGKAVSFLLLAELEGLKDSPLTLTMSALTLKDDHGDADTTPKFCRFQPSLDQMLSCYPWACARRGLCPPPGSTLGGAASSAPPHDSSLGVTDYQVATFVLSNDGGSTT
ncbi:hypothetical protein Tco_1373185, partial [Tanacetum coccineum]